MKEFLKNLLLKQYDEAVVEKIENGYIAQMPVTLRVNNIKSNKSKIQDILNENNIEYEYVEWYDDALIIKNVNEEEIRNLDIYKNGEIYLQSLSSMLPVLFLNPKADENILDMCSAPGGKTTQIASMTQNKAFITATEKNKIRLDRLKYNLDKQGASRINVMQEDSRNLSDYFSFDKILLDAPCSGSGTKNVFDEKFTEELISRSAKTQEALLEKALKILKPGGEMIYSTCSILSIENEDVLNKVLKNKKCQIVPIDIFEDVEILPSKIPGTVCVCPNEKFEGFFIAKIRKGE